MQNVLVSLQARNKTLPLKSPQESRSANKIKISTKGLPKDFFHQDILFPKPKTRCKTQAEEN